MPEEFRERQDEALRRLLRHAVTNVPYYAQLNHSGTLVGALGNFPILTKERIAEAGERLYSNDRVRRRAYANSSGGTTGQPTQVLQDPEYYEHAEAQSLLVRSWRGVGPFERVARLWGAKRDFGTTGALGRIKHYIKNRVVLDCFRMSDFDMERYLHVLNSFAPRLLIGYSTALYELACYAASREVDIRPIPAVHTSAGMLYPHMRDCIEQVFQTEVFNHYGAREVGSIASECNAHEGLHVLGDHVKVEIVDDDGHPCDAGQEGRVLVTSLTNYAMPLLRYDIGDRAVMSSKGRCACGRVYPLIDRLMGRVGETLDTPDGGRVDSSFFIHVIGVLHHHPNVRRFQIAQRALDRFVIRFVLRGELPESVYTGIRQQFAERLGANVSVEFEVVAELPLSSSGKLRTIVSELQQRKS